MVALPGQRVDARQRWRIAGEFRQKMVESGGISFDFDPDAPRLVLDEAVKIESGSETVHKRSKTDPLDDPVDGDDATFHDRGPRARDGPGGIPEILQDSVNGLLHRSEDPADLAAKIVYLLRNPVRAAELG